MDTCTLIQRHKSILISSVCANTLHLCVLEAVNVCRWGAVAWILACFLSPGMSALSGFQGTNEGVCYETKTYVFNFLLHIFDL